MTSCPVQKIGFKPHQVTRLWPNSHGCIKQPAVRLLVSRPARSHGAQTALLRCKPMAGTPQARNGP